MLEARSGGRIEPVDPLWTFHVDRPSDVRAFSGRPLEQMINPLQLTGDAGADVLRHALEPLAEWVPETITNFVVHDTTVVESVARSLTQVWINSTLGTDREALTAAYVRAVRALTESDWSGEHQGPGAAHAIRLLLRMLVNDAARLPAAIVSAVLIEVLDLTGYDDTHAADVLECLASMDAGADGTVGLLAELVIGLTRPRKPLDQVRAAVALIAVQDNLSSTGLERLRSKYLPDANAALHTPHVQEALQLDRALARRVQQAFPDIRGPQ
jgi:hypothetical protein